MKSNCEQLVEQPKTILDKNSNLTDEKTVILDKNSTGINKMSNEFSLSENKDDESKIQ